MKKILVINGPNLNLLGRRQPEIYGRETLDSIRLDVDNRFAGRALTEWRQSNHEGEIVDWIQQAGFDAEYSGIVINAGAYTHTSLAIADAIAAIPAPVIEVHISNIHAREEIRHRSMIAPVCHGSIVGLGTKVYALAVEALVRPD